MSSSGSMNEIRPPTPFEADCARKASPQACYGNRALRLQTCASCSRARTFHGRDQDCRHFVRMTDQQWAAWCGLPKPPRPTEDPFRSIVAEAIRVHEYGNHYKLMLECGHSEIWWWEFNNGHGNEPWEAGLPTRRRLPKSRHCYVCAAEAREEARSVQG